MARWRLHEQHCPMKQKLLPVIINQGSQSFKFSSGTLPQTLIGYALCQQHDITECFEDHSSVRRLVALETNRRNEEHVGSIVTWPPGTTRTRWSNRIFTPSTLWILCLLLRRYSKFHPSWIHEMEPTPPKTSTWRNMHMWIHSANNEHNTWPDHPAIPIKLWKGRFMLLALSSILFHSGESLIYFTLPPLALSHTHFVEDSICKGSHPQ